MTRPRYRFLSLSVAAVTLLVTAALPSGAEARKCKKDAVQVGDACIDTYEASAWELLDPADKKTIKKIQNGGVKNAAQLAGKATQRGVASDDYGAGCPDLGGGCTNLYAASVPGVIPASFITWFQATAACRNAGKRLATNQEWQAAALGTPDTGGADDGATTCNTDSTFSVAPTGSRAGCVSDVGARDMVGNLWEWVANWVPGSTACGSWIGSDDLQCLAGAATSGGPGALIRGGDFENGTNAGPLTVWGLDTPSDSFIAIGFRCARDL